MRRATTNFVILALALVASVLLPAPESSAREQSLREVAQSTGIRALGAARGYASTALWLRAGDAYRRGDLFETLAMYQLIRELQPRNPAVYSYLSWNQAYNISATFPDYNQRFEWVGRGLDTLIRGQERIPGDASLKMDEWHFVLNRSKGYPVDLLRLQLDRYATADPVWARLVRETVKIEAGLNLDERAGLELFLRDVGLSLALNSALSAWAGLAPSEREKLLDESIDYLPLGMPSEAGREFGRPERDLLRSFLKLGERVRTLLLLADWCRMHLLTLVLEPSLKIQVRSISLDQALLNSYLLALKRLVPGTEADYTVRYKRGAARAFSAGVENARRLYDDEGAEEFAAHQRRNYANLPGWLPDGS